jgi:hypothetical protein
MLALEREVGTVRGGVHRAHEDFGAGLAAVAAREQTKRER